MSNHINSKFLYYIQHQNHNQQIYIIPNTQYYIQQINITFNIQQINITFNKSISRTTNQYHVQHNILRSTFNKLISHSPNQYHIHQINITFTKSISRSIFNKSISHSTNQYRVQQINIAFNFSWQALRC